MKKLVLSLLLVSLFISSCAKKEEPAVEKESNVMLEEPSEKTVENVSTATLTPEEEGQKLVEGTDCLSCHKVDAKLVGPSYQEVAAKYTEADIDHLATKIIEGGKGVWGEIPMTPHAGLSRDNAKLMVKYILAQKK